MATITPRRPLRNVDDEFFEALVRSHHPAMLGLARSLAPSSAMAEEVVRDAWQDAIAGLDAFEGPSLRTWVLGLVAGRVEARRGGPGWDVAAPSTPGADGDLTRDLLLRAIEGLPEDQRAVVRLRDVEGWSAQEACDALRIAADEQRVLLHRARRTLREVLYGAAPARA